MDKDKKEKLRQQKAKDNFNSGSASVKLHDQNQDHNVKREEGGRQKYK